MRVDICYRKYLNLQPHFIMLILTSARGSKDFLMEKSDFSDDTTHINEEAIVSSTVLSFEVDQFKADL